MSDDLHPNAARQRGLTKQPAAQPPPVSDGSISGEVAGLADSRGTSIAEIKPLFNRDDAKSDLGLRSEGQSMLNNDQNTQAGTGLSGKQTGSGDT